jgi:hypothetical protein
MKRQPVISSNINEVGYDPVKQVLEVQFRSGAVYRYARVPPDAFHEFMRAGSIGSHFAKFIKPNFECSRIEEQEAA